MVKTMSHKINNTEKLYSERKRRIEAAIRLETPDRVPVTSMVYTFAARFAGISIEDYIFNPIKNYRAHKIFNQEFQPDMNYMPATDMHPLMVALAQPCPVKLPGRDLSPDESWQSLEQKIMSTEEFDYIIKYGFERFMIRLLPRIRPEFLYKGAWGRFRNAINIIRHIITGSIISIGSIRDAKKAGFPTFIGG